MLLQDFFRDRTEVVTVSPDDTVVNAVTKMREENVGAVVVTEDDTVRGILTDRDVALCVVLGAATPNSFVNEIMSKDVKTVWNDHSIFDATQAFHGYKFRRLPVVDHDDRLVGMITLDDLYAVLTRELFNASKALEPALADKV